MQWGANSSNIISQPSKSLLTKASGFIKAYDFTLNPYRGCQYGCSYCYAAAFSPNAEMRKDWGNWLIIKENAVDLLKKELKQWEKKHPERSPCIYMSSVTDPYQPRESKEKLTRQLLMVMLEFQPTLVIQTRSPMICRDRDLLSQFSRLRINMTIPTGSESVRKAFEPRSPSITARLHAIAWLKYNIPSNQRHNVKFSVTMTPLLPTFPEHIDDLLKKLSCVDRVVIQPFHASHKQRLIAATPQAAVDLKSKYNWWYLDEKKSCQDFKERLTSITRSITSEGVEILEGKEGFGYD